MWGLLISVLQKGCQVTKRKKIIFPNKLSINLNKLSDRNAMNYDQNLDQAMLLDKNVLNRLDTNRNILMTDRTNMDQMGMGRDLKMSIMSEYQPSPLMFRLKNSQFFPLDDKDILRKQKFILDILRNVYTTLILDDVHDAFPVEGEMNYYVSSSVLIIA